MDCANSPATNAVLAPNRSPAMPNPTRTVAVRQIAPDHRYCRHGQKPMVIAAEMPVRDQPVASAIGVYSTGSASIAPMTTQPIMPPAATITQR